MPIVPPGREPQTHGQRAAVPTGRNLRCPRGESCGAHSAHRERAMVPIVPRGREPRCPWAESHIAQGIEPQCPRCPWGESHGAHRERAVVPRTESCSAHGERAMVSMGRELWCPGQRAVEPTGREPWCPRGESRGAQGRELLYPWGESHGAQGREPRYPGAELQGPSGHPPGALCSAPPAGPLGQTAAPVPLPHGEDMRVNVNKMGGASRPHLHRPGSLGTGVWSAGHQAVELGGRSAGPPTPCPLSSPNGV